MVAGHLPPELLLKIFHYAAAPLPFMKGDALITMFKDLPACALVCKQWSAYAQDLLYRHACFPCVPWHKGVCPCTTRVPKLIETLKARPELGLRMHALCVGVGSSCWFNTDDEEDILSSLANGAAENTMHVALEILCDLLSLCPNLTMLGLGLHRDVSSALSSLPPELIQGLTTPKNVSELVIHDMDGIGVQLMGLWPSVSELTLGIGFAQFDPFDDHVSMPRLRALAIREYHEQCELTPYVARSNWGLTSLVISGFYIVSPATLPNIPTLEVLCIDGSSGGKGHREYIDERGVPLWPNLRYFAMNHFDARFFGFLPKRLQGLGVGVEIGLPQGMCAYVEALGAIKRLDIILPIVPAYDCPPFKAWAPEQWMVADEVEKDMARLAAVRKDVVVQKRTWVSPLKDLSTACSDDHA